MTEAETSSKKLDVNNTLRVLRTNNTQIYTYITNIIYTAIIIVTKLRRPVAAFQCGCAENENRNLRRGTPVTFKVHLIRQALYFSLYSISNYK
jgi:hypothetical protein